MYYKDIAPTPADALRFWTKVKAGNADDCWPYQEGRNSKGYGKFSIGDESYVAHRVAYVLAKGPISEGAAVVQTCHNRRCCNPRHLCEHIKLATVKAKKQRRTKLDADKASVIRALYSTGLYSQSALGGMYDVSQMTISLVVRNVIWPELDAAAC